MRFSLLTVIALLSGCVYNAPVEQAVENVSAVLSVPIGSAWNKTLSALTDSGYTITQTAKDSGIITTGDKYVRLNESQVDCGNIWGLPYTKDPRTQTLVAYTVRLTEAELNQTKVSIVTRVQGKFVAHAGAQTTELQCRSLGFAENDLLQKISR